MLNPSAEGGSEETLKSTFEITHIFDFVHPSCVKQN